jgi:signal transduction histidine kinase
LTETDLSALLVVVWDWLKHMLALAIPSAALLFAFFKWSGKKWVEQLLNRDLERFKREQQEKLEGFKGEQQTQLERLRHLLSTRVNKIHEKEFEVLPKAWLMLNDLHGAVHRAVDLTIKPYPDFKGFSGAQLESFLNSEPVSSWLSDYQKSELRKADDQSTYYMDAVKGRFIDEANEKHRLFLNYLIEHRIFMTHDLRTKLYAAQTALFAALTSYSIGKDAKDWELMRQGQDQMLNKMQSCIDEVEQAIQARLHYEDAY